MNSNVKQAIHEETETFPENDEGRGAHPGTPPLLSGARDLPRRAR
jgi:hypothetical protein